LKEIVKMIHQESPRIAILGTGGMGKTSLAKAALHHPDIAAKYQHCFFVPCDSATTSIELAALIGAHIGLKPGKDLTNPILRYFSGKLTCLLILDNLEITWEPIDSRSSVEELLSLLTNIDHLAFMVSTLPPQSLHPLIYFRLQCAVLKGLPKFDGLGHFCYPCNPYRMRLPDKCSLTLQMMFMKPRRLTSCSA
jgi:hypothetical protein